MVSLRSTYLKYLSNWSILHTYLYSGSFTYWNARGGIFNMLINHRPCKLTSYEIGESYLNKLPWIEVSNLPWISKQGRDRDGPMMPLV